jgi:hypothetical protein
MPGPKLARELWWAGSLIAAGLVVDLAVVWWNHPLAFIAFLAVACPLVVAGMLMFLWTLVTQQ